MTIFEFAQLVVTLVNKLDTYETDDVAQGTSEHWSDFSDRVRRLLTFIGDCEDWAMTAGSVMFRGSEKLARELDIPDDFVGLLSDQIYLFAVDSSGGGRIDHAVLGVKDGTGKIMCAETGNPFLFDQGFKGYTYIAFRTLENTQWWSYGDNSVTVVAPSVTIPGGYKDSGK